MALRRAQRLSLIMLLILLVLLGVTARLSPDFITAVIALAIAANLFLYSRSLGRPQRFLSKEGIAYLFYDRAAAESGNRGARILITFLQIAVVSALALGAVFLTIVLFVGLLPLFGIEIEVGEAGETVAEYIALSCAGAFVVGLMGSQVMSLKGLLSKSSPRTR